jgi:hypothetical protein
VRPAEKRATSWSSLHGAMRFRFRWHDRTAARCPRNRHRTARPRRPLARRAGERRSGWAGSRSSRKRRSCSGSSRLPGPRRTNRWIRRFAGRWHRARCIAPLRPVAACARGAPRWSRGGGGKRLARPQHTRSARLARVRHALGPMAEPVKPGETVAIPYDEAADSFLERVDARGRGPRRRPGRSG